MGNLSNFRVMWNSYPTGPVDQVLKEIFGEKSNKTSAATRDWVFEKVTDSCTIRLSHAINSTTHKIRRIGSVETITGINGKYIIKVTEMIKYLKLRYGNPQVNAKGSEEITRKAVQGKRGLICFNGIIGACMGHFDLWDGSSVRRSEFFHAVKNVLLWEVSE